MEESEPDVGEVRKTKCCSLSLSRREILNPFADLVTNYAAAVVFAFGLGGLDENTQADFDAMLRATGITVLAWVLTKNMVEAGFNACFPSKKYTDDMHDRSRDSSSPAYQDNNVALINNLCKIFLKQTAYDLITPVVLVSANMVWTLQLSGEVGSLQNATALEKVAVQMGVLHAVFALKVVFLRFLVVSASPWIVGPLVMKRELRLIASLSF